MKKYAITGFDNSYLKWGMSWALSIKQLAKHSDVIIVGFGLDQTSKDKIINLGFQYIEEQPSKNVKEEVFKHIIQLANKEDAVFAYWDADAFFQSSIEDLLNGVEDNFLISNNKNAGFIAANSKRWLSVKELQNITSFIENKIYTFESIVKYFNNFTSLVDDKWNYINVSDLKWIDGSLQTSAIVPIVIHPSGNIKSFLDNKNILFWECHKDLYAGNKTISKRLIFKR